MDKKRLVRDVTIFLALIVLWFVGAHFIDFYYNVNSKNPVKEAYRFYSQTQKDPALKIMDAALVLEVKSVFNEPRLISLHSTLQDIQSFYKLSHLNERQIWVERFIEKSGKNAKKAKGALIDKSSYDDTDAQLIFQNESFVFFKETIEPLLEAGQKDKAILLGKKDIYSLILLAQTYEEKKFARILLQDAEQLLVAQNKQDVKWSDALNFVHEYIRIGDVKEALRVYAEYKKIIPYVPAKLIKAMYQNDELRDQAFALLAEVKREDLLSEYLVGMGNFFKLRSIKQLSPIQQNVLDVIVKRSLGIESIK